MKKFDVAIVGGGASGLACAVSLIRKKPQLTIAIIDACDRLGKKLAATGNGQGNVSNANLSPSHYHGGGAALAEEIACKDYKLPLSLFNCLFETDEEGRVYPSGRQASALSDSLIREIADSSVTVINPAFVTDLQKGFVLTLSTGEKLLAERVVLACGGKAQKQFKTDGSGYSLAQKFGHSVTPLYPSLVQLKTDTQYTKTLKGIRVQCRVTAYGKDYPNGKSPAFCGDVIFTEYGVSGNAIFKLSSYVAGRDNVTLSIEFLPSVSKESVEEDVRRKIEIGYPPSELLSGTLHNQIGRAIIKRAGGDPAAVARTVKDFRLKVFGSLGFDYAQVTRGGVSVKDIGLDLQSKLVKNLYFAGEILDVDGDCGGYNLNWAFASGMRVAESIISDLK